VYLDLSMSVMLLLLDLQTADIFLVLQFFYNSVDLKNRSIRRLTV